MIMQCAWYSALPLTFSGCVCGCTSSRIKFKTRPSPRPPVNAHQLVEKTVDDFRGEDEGVYEEGQYYDEHGNPVQASWAASCESGAPESPRLRRIVQYTII